MTAVLGNVKMDDGTRQTQLLLRLQNETGQVFVSPDGTSPANDRVSLDDSVIVRMLRRSGIRDAGPMFKAILAANGEVEGSRQAPNVWPWAGGTVYQYDLPYSEQAAFLLTGEKKRENVPDLPEIRAIVGPEVRIFRSQIGGEDRVEWAQNDPQDRQSGASFFAYRVDHRFDRTPRPVSKLPAAPMSRQSEY
jgi:hypothetical protein